MDRAAEAAPLHRKALDLQPGDPRLLGHYGDCLLARGFLDEARQAYESALLIDAANVDARAGMERLQAMAGTPAGQPS
jgi:Flp pilus assembly protein TadD